MLFLNILVTETEGFELLVIEERMILKGRRKRRRKGEMKFRHVKG